MGDKGFLFHINVPVDNLKNINGQNVTWDYSNHYLSASTPSVIEVMLPENSSYSPTMFDPQYIQDPNKYAIQLRFSNGGATMTFFNYPEGNSEYCQGFSYRGAFSPNVNGDLVSEFANQAQKTFNFPFNFGDAINQTTQGNTGFDWGLEHVPSQGNYLSEVDGKGTLKLGPGIEINNVIRHKLLDTINISNNNYNVIYREIYSYYNFSISKFPLFMHSWIKFGKNNGIVDQVISVFTSEHKTANLNENVLQNTTVYPNPVEDYLNIEFPFLISETNLEILDNLGKTVMHKSISNQNSKIDLSKLKPGIYFLKIEIDGVEKLTKIIKR